MDSILDMLKLRCRRRILSSSISTVCSGQFCHSLLRQNKKYLKVELRLCFEIETKDYVASRILLFIQC